MAKKLNPSETSSTMIEGEKEIKTQSYLESESSLISSNCTNVASLDSSAPTAIDLQNSMANKNAIPSETAGAKSSSGVTHPSSSRSSGSSNMTKLDSTEELEVYDLKCLLLADANIDTAPLHLRQILKHFDEFVAAPSQPELLLLLIYCIALEMGFITQTEYETCSNKIVHLASITTFHTKNLMYITRFPPTYECSDCKTHFTMRLYNLVKVRQNDMPKTDLLNSLLTCLVSGDFLIATLTPGCCSNIPGRSLCLSIPRYVLGTKVKGKAIYQRFRKLNELSNLLRESLFLPVRNQQMEMLNIGIYPGLLGLPAEMYEAIFDYLSPNQLKILANVCKPLYYLSTHSKRFEK